MLCIYLANISFPTPDSPKINILTSLQAAFFAIFMILLKSLFLDSKVNSKLFFCTETDILLAFTFSTSSNKFSMGLLFIK